MFKALKHLQSILIPEETTDCTAIQRRVFALLHRRTIIAATNNRFIGMTRGLFGGFTPITIRWQDLKNVETATGVIGARISVTALEHPDLATSQAAFSITYGGLRKAEAQAVYRVCQAQEQAWREKRRLRELEELRAKSGGIQLGAFTGVGATGISSAPTGDLDPTTRLANAKRMLEQKLISNSEYETIKAQILSRI